MKGVSKGVQPLRMAYGLAGAVFLSTLGVGVFAFAIPLLALHDKMSGLMLGVSFSGYFLAKLVISPVAGKLSDKVGPRPLLVAAATVGMLAPMAAFASLRHEILYAIQFFLGLSAGTMKPVATAAVIPNERRGRMFGLCNALYNAAFFLGPVLGGFLYYDRYLAPVLGFLAACMAVSLAVILVLTPESLATASEDEAAATAPARNRTFRGGALLLAVCGRTACTAALIAFYPALLSENLHGPTWLVGLMFALPSMMACLFLPMGGRLADRFDKEALTVAGMALSAVCLILTGKMETAFGFMIAGIILGLGSSLSFPASMALASSMGRKQGNIMGWFHGAANAGFVIGPLLCGLLVEQYAEIPLPMAVMGSLGLLTALPLALGRFLGREAFSWRPVATTLFAAALIILAVTGINRSPLEQDSQAASMPQTSLNFAGIAMGNVVHITMSGVETEKGGEDSQAAFETITRLESEFSHRNGSGSVGRINMAAGVTPEVIGKAAFDLIGRALNVCKASDGIFDITIGAVTTLPYYYQEKAEQEKAALVDYRKVVVDDEKQTVFLPEEGMALDLGGLAKGTVLDGAAATLRERGVPAALVEAGGDLYCYGDREWKVGIQDPRGEGMLGVISVANAGVCGSGDYYQYAMTEENGTTKRKHHILDPELLDSADKSIAVTVVAPSTELADALATTLFIMGPREGEKLLEKFDGSSALWILPDRSMVASKNFPSFSH